MNNLFPALLVLILLLPNIIFASEPAVWSVNTRAEVLKGDSHGVSIGPDGTITIAPKLTEVFKTEQPYIWSSVIDSASNVYLGTGGDGKIFRVDAAGKGTLFSDLAELNVTSLALGGAGELFAATSPDGKVYRIDASGAASVYFEPKEKYVWSIAIMPDKSLAVATGDGGKIYRVRSAGAAPAASLLFDTSETHIISLAVDQQGNLYAGSDSNGLVMRFGPDGRPFGLLDSPLREIHELAVGRDGSVYVLALGDSASAAKPETAATPAETKTASPAKPNPATSEPPAKSRYDLTGAKSAVYRILPDGATEVLWASTTVSGFSLYAHQSGAGVLVGTSDRGRIIHIGNDGEERLVLQTGADQISNIINGRQFLIATSSNQGSMYRFASDDSAEGSYESPVLDAKGSASWGRIWWRSTGNVAIQTRSGNTEKANETWSQWSTPLTDQKGGAVSSPVARYIQWRAVLKPSAVPASLNEVNLAYIPRNIAPEVLSIQVLPTNVGLVPNPPVQVDPNIAAAGLDPSLFGVAVAQVAPRRVYLRAATSLQWTAEDRNGDKMVYDILYREAGESAFKLLKEAQSENFIAIDGQSLADGRYIFKVVARDTPSNPVPLALSGERITESIDIDNTPPTVTASGTPQIANGRARVVFDASDAASYMTRAEYSVNGGQWIAVYADDGISDSARERYTIDIPVEAGREYAVTIRVFDVNGNAGNARTVIRR